jgi:hypothetical protein
VKGISDLCPPLVGEITNYNLRNSQAIQQPQVRTESYRKSFFPSAINIWNSLDLSLRNAPSLNSFKYRLKSNPRYVSNNLYSRQTGRSAVHQTRMRLGLSALNDQRYDYGLIEDRQCPNCRNGTEDVIHFFFECPVYAAARTALFLGLNHLNIDNDISRRKKNNYSPSHS